MFKSKHSGWTWELKRTPFGGGNPLDTVSNILGTNGGQSGILGNVEALGQNVSNIGVGLDKWVNNLTPMGWALPAAIVAAYLTGGGSLAAEGAAEGGAMAAGAEGAGGTVGSLGAGGSFVPAAEGASFTITPGAAYTVAGTSAGATAAGEAAYNAALQNGLSQIEATNAANQAAANYAYNLGGQGITSQSGQQAFFDALANGSTSQEALNQGIAAQYSGQGLTAGEDLANIMANYPNMSAQQLQDILRINYGTDPMLSADAANLAKNGYDAATINQVLGYSYSPTELAGTGIQSNALDAASASNLSDTLKNINRARSLAKLLGADQSQIQYKNLPSAQQYAQHAAQTLAAVPQQQFGGLYEMNKNPFTFQNPIATALTGANKQPGVFDVSGTPGTSLNTAQQNQIYSSLLRS